MSFEKPGNKKEEKIETFKEWDEIETGLDREDRQESYVFVRLAGLFDDPDFVAALKSMTPEKLEAYEKNGYGGIAEVSRFLKSIEDRARAAREGRRRAYEDYLKSKS